MNAIAAKRGAYAEDGAVLVEGALDAGQLAKCRAVYDWVVAHPGPGASFTYKGTDKQTYVENANRGARGRLDELATTLPFGELFAELWDSEHVWYFAEEVFLKADGVGGRTPWHQDTSYLPWGGAHWANAWISFEAVPKANALEIVRGSHLGVRYDGSDFHTADDPTAPLHGDGSLPRLPDIEAQRKNDPAAYDILSWATNPGDIVVLHPGALHGGAAVDERFRDRHTLVLRFFGDDSTFRALPEGGRSGYTRAGMLFAGHIGHLRDGEPFRSPFFRQLR